MQAGRDMKRFLPMIFLALCAATANADVIYDVNRTIGAGSGASAGTVTGFIITDGTLGTINKDNIDTIIKEWSITLIPDLNEGQSYTFGNDSGGNGDGKILIGGTAVSATSAGLEYDFSVAGTNYFLLMSSAISIPGGITNYFWCLETINCSDGSDLSEQIGHTIAGSDVIDQLDQYTDKDKIVFATVVPVPAAVWLFASGLLGLVGVARRKR